MSAEVLPRELGVILRCNGKPVPATKDPEGYITTADGDCGATITTALIVVKHNRAAAKSLGWSRGGRTGSKRMDFCPACSAIEAQLVANIAKTVTERRTARDEARKKKGALLSGTATESGASAP